MEPHRRPADQRAGHAADDRRFGRGPIRLHARALSGLIVVALSDPDRRAAMERTARSSANRSGWGRPIAKSSSPTADERRVRVHTIGDDHRRVRSCLFRASFGDDARHGHRAGGDQGREAAAGRNGPARAAIEERHRRRARGFRTRIRLPDLHSTSMHRLIRARNAGASWTGLGLGSGFGPLGGGFGLGYEGMSWCGYSVY